MSSSKLSDAVYSLLCNEQGRIWEHVRTDGNVATWRATQNVTLSSTLNLPQRVQRPCVAFCFKDDCVQINVDAAPVTNTDPETGRVRIVYPVVKPEALVEECRRKPDPDNIKVYALKFDPDSYKAGTPIYAARDMMLETSHRFGSIAITFTRKNSDNTSDNPLKRRKQAEPSAASSYPCIMSADTFPMLIIELARVRSDPSRLLATAVLDAIGVMFLQIRHSPVNTVEIAWLVRHAHTLVTFAQDVIGVGWEHEVPEAAAVLRTVLTLSVGSPRDVSDAYPATVCLGSSKDQKCTQDSLGVYEKTPSAAQAAKPGKPKPKAPFSSKCINELIAWNQEFETQITNAQTANPKHAFTCDPLHTLITSNAMLQKTYKAGIAAATDMSYDEWLKGTPASIEKKKLQNEKRKHNRNLKERFREILPMFVATSYPLCAYILKDEGKSYDTTQCMLHGNLIQRKARELIDYKTVPKSYQKEMDDFLFEARCTSFSSSRVSWSVIWVVNCNV